MATTTAPKKSPAVRKAALQAAKALKLLGEAESLLNSAALGIRAENHKATTQLQARAAQIPVAKLRDTLAKVFPAPAE